MKTRVLLVERKASDSVSIERVFRQVVKGLPPDEFDVEFQTVPYGNGVGAILKNLLFFRRTPADIYHITGDIHYISLVLPAPQTILTIHDLIFLHRRSGVRRFVLKKLFLDLPLRRLRRITVVSQAVKEEILRLTDADPDKILVIENPLVEGFTGHEHKPFDSACPVILHIGTAANKNLTNLIRAAKGLTCQLRIVGRLDDKIRQELLDAGTVYENAFGLSETEIIEEYKNADIVSFCSTYEGFGLPIIEAQAMRKPVITSDRAPMNHVAGSGAVLVDPVDVAAIRAGLEGLINDVEFREALVAAGSVNLERFTGKISVSQYAELYRQVLAESN